MKESHLIVGRKPVMEAVKSNKSIDKIYILQSMSGMFEHELRNLCKDNLVPLVRVPEHKLNKMYRGNHQGIVAAISTLKFYELSDVIAKAYEDGRDPRFIVLDGVTDVRNFGAIARSTLAFDIDGIIISIKKSAACNEDAVKSSAGALLDLPVIRVQSILDAVDQLKAAGIPIWSSSLLSDTDMVEVDWKGPLAVVLGSESRGVSREVLAVSDGRFRISQSNNIESLNVSVSAGIILHHIYVKRTVTD